ncbi:MAG: WecB/TagA/CpsF family glycosyltransferase [Phycisphaerae bacterium]
MNILILAVTALLLVPVAVFCAECLAALLPRRKKPDAAAPRPRLAILIPAHNEELVLRTTLDSLIPQVRDGDRLVVIADNCSDSTAALARAASVEVIERYDSVRRGKGYALDFGLRHLETTGAPGILVMMDADCHAHPGSVESLAEQVVRTGQPAQAVYLLDRPTRPGPRDLVSALAFMVKNLVRPSGLGRMGLPCLLTGTGMAFPWAVIRRAKLASGNIVEDMQLGLDLALAGHPPMFCQEARVTGRLPDQAAAATTQRTRWEHGHLQTMLTQVPRLVKGALKHRKVAALALAFELCVPPLSLLIMMVLAAAGAATLAAKFGASWVSANLLLGGLAASAFCVFATWAKFGRHQLPLTSLLAAPFYVAWKIPLYFAFIVKPQKEWVRTDRATADDDRRDNDDDFGGMPANDAFPAFAQPSVIDLAGVNVHAVTEVQTVRQILHRSNAGRGGVVVTPNLDHLRRCRKDAEFASLVDKADLVVADGMPLVWASKLQGTPLPGRVAGSDLISSLSAAAAKAGKSLFLLGGDPGTADAAAKVLTARHPDIQIAGTFCPEVGFEKDPAKLAALTRAVIDASPDIVFVALGSPKQERLIEALRHKLPSAWWLGVGISFSFLCGNVKRAPKWMRKTGLEWIHRLTQEPGRLFKRYLVHGVPFAARLLVGSTFKGLGRKFRPRRQLTVDSGMGTFAVDVLDSDVRQPARPANRIPTAAAEPASPDSPVVKTASASAADVVYRSFLSGFAAELFGGDPHAQGMHPVAGKPHSPPSSLRNLKAILLLGGSVRPSKLIAAVGRSILDLPMEDGFPLLKHWRDQALHLRELIGCEALPVRVMVDRASPVPTLPVAVDGVVVQVERDLSPFRGTGGLLRDIAAEYADEDLLLVGTAAQALLSPLADLAAALADLEADVSLIVHADGTPSGLMLVRCGALRKIAASGYVDMKEQALPQIAKDFTVSHLYQAHATGLPIRSLEEYISAVQRRYRLVSGKPLPNDPFAEDRRPTFAIVEHGATIDPGARVHDSVILRGALVDDGAMVVRSIVCPGGMLAAGETAVDSLVMNAEVAAR